MSSDNRYVFDTNIAANAPRADVAESLPRWIPAQGVARVVPNRIRA